MIWKKKKEKEEEVKEVEVHVEYMDATGKYFKQESFKVNAESITKIVEERITWTLIEKKFKNKKGGWKRPSEYVYAVYYRIVQK